MKQFILFSMGLFFVAGCTRGLDSALDPAPASLSLTASGVDWRPAVASEAGLIDEPVPVGKATENRFQPKDEIGVFLYSGALQYHSINMRYFTLDGSPDGSTSPQWAAGAAMGGALNAGTSYVGAAYYPYKEGATNASAVPHTVATDQTASAGAEATALERSDFLWAAPVEVQTPTSHPSVALTFAHAMTKMVVNLDVPMVVDGVPVSKANKITIKGLYSSCTVDLRTGAVGNLSASADVVPRLLSGDLLPGKRSVWEAVVVPQELDVNYALIEVRCQTSAGEKVVNYFPPGAGLTLEGGKKVTFMLTSSADLAITSDLDLFTGVAETGLPLKVKTTNGTPWTLSSSQPWLTLSTTAGGTYTASIGGTGTGADQTVYVKTLANTGTGAVSRDAVLTLSATLSGVVRSVTYRAVQNYSVPVTGFPVTSMILPNFSMQLPAVKGNSKWYIKSGTPLPKGLVVSSRNVAYEDLQPEDIVDVVSGSGFEVLGNYFNTGGALYVVADLYTPTTCVLKCNGVDVTVDARSTAVTTLNPTTQQYETTHWAKGNLVGANARGKGGLGAAKIGHVTDDGLYFRMGSLIGWSGGAQASGGSGVGNIPVEWEGKWWGGSNVWSWAKDAYLWPTELGDTPPITYWPSGGSASNFDRWYYSYSVAPWNTENLNIRDFNIPMSGDSGTGNLGTGRYYTLGVGDACSYYLGPQWRGPSFLENTALLNYLDVRTLYTKINGAARTSINGLECVSFQNGVFTTALWGGYTSQSGARMGIGSAMQVACTSTASNGVGLFAMALTYADAHPKNTPSTSRAFQIRCVRNL